MSAKISIIIPVYNLEDYVENCINSLLNQTYDNIEVLCIDDGSTDNSATVIKKLAKGDQRVKYIYKENGGVSSARNEGLEVANGEYIMFVDGDDYMHYQAVGILVRCIEEKNCDMVSAHQTHTSSLAEEMKEIVNYNCTDASHEDLFREVNGNVIGKSSCAKLFRKDFALKARFPVGIANGEDANYIIRLLANGAEVCIVDLILYYYYSRENSCVTSEFTQSKFSITLSFDDLCEYLKNSDYKFLKAYCLQYLYQSILYNRTSSIGTSAQKYVLAESKRIGNKWLKEFIKNSDINIVIRIAFVIFFKSRHLYEFVRMIQDPTMKDFYKNRKKNRKV